MLWCQQKVIDFSLSEINPNLGRLFRGSFWGGGGVGVGSKITPYLKLVRIMLGTWNLVDKYTHILVSENIPFSTKALADVSIFFAKNLHFLGKIVSLLNAIVSELC